MRYEWVHQCNICHTSYDTRKYEKCPNCHRSKDSVRCPICKAIYDAKEYRTCSTCHSSLGSVRCTECNRIINDQVNFCPCCGVDRRWEKFYCPDCYAEITVLKKGGPDLLECPKCGRSFIRPDKAYLLNEY